MSPGWWSVGRIAGYNEWFLLSFKFIRTINLHFTVLNVFPGDLGEPAMVFDVINAVLRRSLF